MGDEWKSEFSREELESMGESPLEGETQQQGPETQEAEKKETETKSSETEQTPELEQETEGEAEGEAKEAVGEAESEPEEGKPVPYERFSKVYGQRKQAERERDETKEKLDLYKRDQEAYFARYPDEKPADWKPAQEKETPKPTATRIIPMREMLNAIVNDPTNENFHGKSLHDLLQEGPEGVAAAYDYYNTYVESVRDEVRKVQDHEVQSKQALEREVNDFVEDRAKELFQKPSRDLTGEEQASIDKTVNDVIDWMKKNKRSNYSLTDAYLLMRHNDLIRQAAHKGASAVVDHAKSGIVKSVGTGGNQPPPDPYAKYLSMSEKDLTALLMQMGDGEYTKFMAEASPGFRKKFPSLAY